MIRSLYPLQSKPTRQERAAGIGRLKESSRVTLCEKVRNLLLGAGRKSDHHQLYPFLIVGDVPALAAANQASKGRRNHKRATRFLAVSVARLAFRSFRLLQAAALRRREWNQQDCRGVGVETMGRRKRGCLAFVRRSFALGHALRGELLFRAAARRAGGGFVIDHRSSHGSRGRRRNQSAFGSHDQAESSEPEFNRPQRHHGF